MRARAFLAAALAFLPLAAGAEPRVEAVPLPFAATEFRGPGSRAAAVAPTLDAIRENRTVTDAPLAVMWGPGGAAAIARVGDALRVVPMNGAGPDLAAAERGRGAIPGSRVAVSGAVTATLTDATGRIAHGALGSAGEAGAITISERLPVPAGGGAQAVPTRTSRVEAGPDAAFEDRTLRFADLDGARPAILAVKSYAARGAALAVIGRAGDGWSVLAETPPLGEPGTWLDPAAAGPFGPGGAIRIALVARPHRDGMLQLWRFAGGALTLVAERAGFANHVFGSGAQDLATIVDLPGQAEPGLAVPSLDRKSLVLLSLRDNVEERARIPLPAAAATGVARLGSGPGAPILVGLEDGRVVVVRP